jgi:hypothetical protein
MAWLIALGVRFTSIAAAWNECQRAAASNMRKDVRGTLNGIPGLMMNEVYGFLA